MRWGFCRLAAGLLIATLGAYAAAPSHSHPPGASSLAPAAIEQDQRSSGGLRQPEQIPAGAWKRMLESVASGRYAVRAAGDETDLATYEAANPAHGLRATFAHGEVRVAPAHAGEPGWEWTMRLERFGYAGSLDPVEAVAPLATRDRVEYRRTALTEWYVNDSRGLEQGFTLERAPASGGVGHDEAEVPLVLELRAAGLDIRPDVAGRSILLRSDDGAEILRYGGLIAWDAVGTDLPAEMWATARGIRIEVDDRGAAYPVTIDPLVETVSLRSSDLEEDDQFGTSVAVQGDTAIVGAPNESGGPGSPITNAGAAYVFERDLGGANNWGEAAKLVASDAQAYDFFGISVAISQDTALVGARGEDGGPGDALPGAGAAYLFERDQGGAGNWGETVKLTAADAQAGDVFGNSVALAGDTAVVGAPSEDGGVGDPLGSAGAAYVFDRDQGGAGNWGEAAKLTASDAQAVDLFGWSASISGDTALIGAWAEDGGPGDPLSASGAAYLFARDQGGAGNWGEVTKLTSSDAQAFDQFGAAVAVSGSTAIVGAYAEDGPLDAVPWAGAAYVFERDQGGTDNWGEVTKLAASNAQADNVFGFSVAIDGDVAIVGALSRNGSASVFGRDEGGAGNWGEVQVLSASDYEPGDRFGNRVSGSGFTIVVGAFSKSRPFDDMGRAYVFDDRVLWAYILEKDGDLREIGTGVVPITPPPPNFGFDIARDAELLGDGMYVLDGFGGIHSAGGTPAMAPPPPYFGFDIARDFELASGGGGYVLEGFGGVHVMGGAPVLAPSTPYFGFDIAKDLELGGGGYYVLDGFGGVHAGAGAAVMSPAPPYFGFDAALDLELAQGGGGYVLDHFGGVHPLGGAPLMLPITPYPIDAVDLELVATGFYVMQSQGALHAGGGAQPFPPIANCAFCIREIEIREIR